MRRPASFGQSPVITSRDSRQVTQRVREIVAPILRALELELVDIECTGQGTRTILRVFIEKPGGVTLGDCEQVHQSLSHALDVEDPISHAYTLEVSSPGLDRPLRQRDDFRRVLARQVKIKLRQPRDGEWRVQGRLVDVQDEGVTLACLSASQEENILVGWTEIVEARQAVAF